MFKTNVDVLIPVTLSARPFNVTQLCKIFNFIGIKCKIMHYIRTNLFNNNYSPFCFVQLKSG